MSIFTLKIALSKSQPFGNITIDEVREEQRQLQNQNTLSIEKKAVKAFKDYLEHIGVENTDFFTYTEAKLDGHLSTFWFNARKKNGDHYNASSMETMRYGLNRALKRYGHNNDITKKSSISFTQLIGSYNDA